jgi:hypothetical protein
LPMLDPLYTSEEMKAAEAGHDVPTMMERAGRAVAEEALRRYPDARSFGAVCGGGANGGDGRIALEVLRAAGREASEGCRRQRPDRRALRHRLQGRAPPGGGGADRGDERGRCPGRRGRPAVGRQRRHRRDRRRGRERGRHRDDARP